MACACAAIRATCRCATATSSSSRPARSSRHTEATSSRLSEPRVLLEQRPEDAAAERADAGHDDDTLDDPRKQARQRIERDRMREEGQHRQALVQRAEADEERGERARAGVPPCQAEDEQ